MNLGPGQELTFLPCPGSINKKGWKAMTYKKVELRNIWKKGSCTAENTNVVFIDGKRATKEDIPKTEAYKDLVIKAEALGMPRHYKDDLYKHDRMRLYKYKPKAFFWVLRDCGTNMVITQEAIDILDHLKSLHPEARLYFWRKIGPLGLQGLIPISFDDIKEYKRFLAEEKDFFDWMVFARPKNDWTVMSSTIRILEKGLFKYTAIEKAARLNMDLNDAMGYYYAAGPAQKIQIG